MTYPVCSPPPSPPPSGSLVTRRRKRRPVVKLTPAVITHIHHYLPPDAHGKDIHAMAEVMGLSYSTVWHVVRGYCRHADASWKEG